MCHLNSTGKEAVFSPEAAATSRKKEKRQPAPTAGSYVGAPHRLCTGAGKDYHNSATQRTSVREHASGVSGRLVGPAAFKAVEQVAQLAQPQALTEGGSADDTKNNTKQTGIDAELAAVIEAWSALPEAIRAGVAALVRAAQGADKRDRIDKT